MSKKFIKKNFFFSVRPNNLNWETLTKNLVIFLKDRIGLWWKFLILWGFTEKSDFYGGFTKKTICSRELPKKQACTICRFNLRRGALWKRGWMVLLKERAGWYPMNAHYELASLADSYASLSCFSKSHSNYTVNISSTLLPRQYT